MDTNDGFEKSFDEFCSVVPVGHSVAALPCSSGLIQRISLAFCTCLYRSVVNFNCCIKYITSHFSYCMIQLRIIMHLGGDWDDMLIYGSSIPSIHSF